MWSYLVALVLAPLLATAGLGAAAVHVRLGQVHRLEAAERLLGDSVRIDAVRRAVDQELMPTLVASVVNDDATAQRAGLTGATRNRLHYEAPARVAEARTRTDAALTAAAASSGTAGVARSTRLRLLALRIDVNAELVAPAVLASRYLGLSDSLAGAEHDAAARAGATGVDTRTARAIDDVGYVVDVTGLASRQLPLLFAALVVSGAPRLDLERQLQQTVGAFGRSGATSGVLDDPQLRDGVHDAITYGVSTQIATRLGAPGALEAGDPAELLPSQVLDLATASDDRDAVLAGLLDRAVASATRSSAADRDAAQAQLSVAVLLVVAVLVGSAAVTAAVGRGLQRALARLALAADQAREGVAFEAPDRGPRELRRVGAALEQTASGLHRVREQVEAVARGDLARALAVVPVSGALGEGVHASVEAMVRAVAAGDSLRAQLAHRAATDALTGLPNRDATLAAVDRGLLRARAGAVAGAVAVLFIDLDGFKQVNDCRGHAAGDEVLRESARRMSSAVRGDDVVGRLGGDEFVVVAHDVDAAAASALAERLVHALGEPVALGPGLPPAEVGASIGVALTRGGVRDADALLAEADGAVYRAKAQGRRRMVMADADAAPV